MAGSLPMFSSTADDLPQALLHVLWHFLAGLAVYFGSLSDAQVRVSIAPPGMIFDKQVTVLYITIHDLLNANMSKGRGIKIVC